MSALPTVKAHARGKRIAARGLVMRDFSRWNCSRVSEKIIWTAMIFLHFILMTLHMHAFCYLPRGRLILSINEKQLKERPLTSLVSLFAFSWAIFYQPHMAFICATC